MYIDNITFNEQNVKLDFNIPGPNVDSTDDLRPVSDCYWYTECSLQVLKSLDIILTVRKLKSFSTSGLRPPPPLSPKRT